MELNLEELQKSNEELKAENANLLKANEALTLEVEKLSSAPQSATPAPAQLSKATFKLGADEYGFAYPAVMHNGEKITADHVLASEDLQKELVEIQSGFLIKK